MTITKIKYDCPTSSMGDIPEQHADGYRNWISLGLQSEFPDAEIVVTAEQSTNCIQTDADGDDYHALSSLHAFVQNAGDSCNWEWVEGNKMTTFSEVEVRKVQHTFETIRGIECVDLEIRRIDAVEAIDVLGLSEKQFHGGGWEVTAVVNGIPAGVAYTNGGLGAIYHGTDDTVDAARHFLGP